MNQKKSLKKRLYGLKALLRDFWFFGWHRQLWYLMRFWNAKPQGKFVLIYCQGRTGSTFLSSALNQYKTCLYEEEVMRRRLWHYKSFLTGLSFRKPDVWYVVKVKPMHLRNHGIPSRDFLHWIHQHQCVLIHLRREDFFEHGLSKIIAAKRGEYFKKLSADKLKIDKEYLLEKIAELKEFAQEEKAILGAYGPIEVVYEKDIKPVEAQEATLMKLCKALSIKESYVAPPVFKVLSTNLEDEVLNWDEIKALK